MVDKQNRKHQDKLVAEERMQIAKVTRERSLEDKSKKSVLQLFRWDLIREHRAEEYDKAWAIRKNSEKMQYWVRIIKARALI